MPIQYDLFRVPAKGMGRAIVVSHDVVGADTHYWRGRSQPCSGDKCEACEDGQSPRWRGYLAVMSPKSGRVVILEITAAAAGAIEAYFNKHRTLRGAGIVAERVGQKPNGRLRLMLTPPAAEIDQLPKAPQIQRLLARIWGLNQDRTATGVDEQKLRLAKDDGGPDFGKIA